MPPKKNEEVTSDNAGEETAAEITKPEVDTPVPVKVKLAVKAPSLDQPNPPATTKIVEQFKGVKVKRLGNYAGLKDIAYQTPGSAGMDLYAAIPAGTEVKLPPFGRVLIPTGLSMEIPVGFEGQIRPRSGLALKQGLTCLNTPGTIDSDYRGEVGVILYNASNNMARVKRGDRIAQIVFAAVARMPLEYTDDLSETERGDGGFGSTGV